jgi:hypothetical protein
LLIAAEFQGFCSARIVGKPGGDHGRS